MPAIEAFLAMAAACLPVLAICCVAAITVPSSTSEEPTERTPLLQEPISAPPCRVTRPTRDRSVGVRGPTRARATGIGRANNRNERGRTTTRTPAVRGPHQSPHPPTTGLRAARIQSPDNRSERGRTTTKTPAVRGPHQSPLPPATQARATRVQSPDNRGERGRTTTRAPAVRGPHQSPAPPTTATCTQWPNNRGERGRTTTRAPTTGLRARLMGSPQPPTTGLLARLMSPPAAPTTATCTQWPNNRGERGRTTTTTGLRARLMGSPQPPPTGCRARLMSPQQPPTTGLGARLMSPLPSPPAVTPSASSSSSSSSSSWEVEDDKTAAPEPEAQAQAQAQVDASDSDDDFIDIDSDSDSSSYGGGHSPHRLPNNATPGEIGRYRARTRSPAPLIGLAILHAEDREHQRPRYAGLSKGRNPFTRRPNPLLCDFERIEAHEDELAKWAGHEEERKAMVGRDIEAAKERVRVRRERLVEEGKAVPIFASAELEELDRRLEESCVVVEEIESGEEEGSLVDEARETDWVGEGSGWVWSGRKLTKTATGYKKGILKK